MKELTNTIAILALVAWGIGFIALVVVHIKSRNNGLDKQSIAGKKERM